MGEGDDTKFAFRSHEKFDYKRLFIWSRLPGIQWSVSITLNIFQTKLECARSYVVEARAKGPRKFLNLESLKCHFLDFEEDLTEFWWSENSVLVCRNLQFSSTIWAKAYLINYNICWISCAYNKVNSAHVLYIRFDITLISVFSEVYATTSEKTKHRYFSLKKIDYTDILRAIE
jgi:hypothetical protein